MKKMKLIIEVQINKHRWNVIYKVNDWVWLSFRNVKTTRLCKDLKDKQLSLYQITAKISVFYYLRLLISMKHLHLMFSSKLLQSYSKDSSIRTAFRIIQINHYWKRWTLKDRWYIELQMLSRLNTVQSQINRSK